MYRLAGTEDNSENDTVYSDDISHPLQKLPKGRLLWQIFTFLALLVCVLMAIFMLRFPALRQSMVPIFQVSTALEPILGSTISETGLYFPAQGLHFYPTVASYNQPPIQRPRTPLFIPFTRNNDMLRQTVLGYIAAGWPREDIVIVDNSGTLDANSKGLLSKDNPFFLDYDLFRIRYGVSIQQTPTLLNFAQLQNYILRMALGRKWTYYFWSHMDVGILSYEDMAPYKSFYQRVLMILQEGFSDDELDNAWGVKFFGFDNLALVNVAAWRTIGQWDVFIPYYATDCDAYARLKLQGFDQVDVEAGYIWDVAEAVSDPEHKFFPPMTEPTHMDGNQPSDPMATNASLNSPRFKSLRKEFDALQAAKLHNSKGRNTWQNRQKGGKNEPWTYDPTGFQEAWWKTAESGRQLFTAKWGTDNCDLVKAGRKLEDAWKNAKDVTG